jgi:uncharacterized damage-inducible protein DinB
MNYYGAKDLAESFRTVRKNTLVIANEIGEEHYGFRPAPDTRTIAQTLFHISATSKIQEHIHGELKLTTLEGFDFPGFFLPMVAAEQESRNKAQIIQALTESGDRFGAWLESLSDDFLGERVSMPPGMTPASKSRFEMILSVKEHEMHHRAQLMMTQRMIGQVTHLTREMNARIAEMMAAKATA